MPPAAAAPEELWDQFIADSNAREATRRAAAIERIDHHLHHLYNAPINNIQNALTHTVTYEVHMLKQYQLADQAQFKQVFDTMAASLAEKNRAANPQTQVQLASDGSGEASTGVKRRVEMMMQDVHGMTHIIEYPKSKKSKEKEYLVLACRLCNRYFDSPQSVYTHMAQ